MLEPTSAAWKAWATVLQEKGFSGDGVRLKAVCDFLFENDFEWVEDMRGSKNPSSWCGAQRLSEGNVI